MGTGKCGRYLNAEGSDRIVSDFAVVHSDEGRYTTRKTDGLQLVSGGHGQTGMDQLDKYGIEYKIEKTYSNGVRVGYLPDHRNPNKKKSMSQSWFPRSWTPEDIRRAGEHVAGLKGNRNALDGEKVFGVFRGVRVGIIKTKGKIATVFPDSDQSSVLKKGKK